MSDLRPVQQMAIQQSVPSFGRDLTGVSPSKKARSGPMAERIFGGLAKGADVRHTTLGQIESVLK